MESHADSRGRPGASADGPALAEGQALWNSIFALSERLTGDPLALLPAVFAIVQGWAGRASVSLDPDDPGGRYFEKNQSAPDGDGRAGVEPVKRPESEVNRANR